MKRLSVRVAASPREASSWKGHAVVVDVLRCSTTLCALLESGRTEVAVYADKGPALAAARRDPRTDFFSELDFGPAVRRNDNSPYVALRKRGRSRRAILITGSGTPAMLSLRKAARILVGCFANLPAVARRMEHEGGRWLIVPACLFLNPRDVEDIFCARAIQDRAAGKDRARVWLAKVRASHRPKEFVVGRPQTGKADLRLALSVGWSRQVPEVVLRAGRGQVRDAALP